MLTRKAAARAALLFLLTASLAPALGQGSRAQKPYQQWTISDVLHVLHNPPWAQTAGGVGDSYMLTARLFSARPIRQALVRQRQLMMNYDKLGEADRARFDADMRAFLDCADCSKFYVVTLSGRTPGGLTRTLGRLPLDELRRRVHLTNERGESRPLSHVRASEGLEPVVMFAFERFDEKGAPLFTAGNKHLHFKLDDKLFEKELISLRKFTFEVRRLSENGEVIF
ncbi:MAG: hypothetical protein M3416_11475 [Acidobacteriota bacterium]|nr:hypothetical protein [Acidobacteriota bacterium]